jgi:(p)ppGpp synthase/HD superfamily hydrolase
MRALFKLILVVLIISSSCEKNNNKQDYSFEAEILGKNSDCGVFAIKFADKLDQVRTIAETSSLEDVYIAKNLPIDLQTAGLVIILNIRKPEASELGACTDLGPSYPWIFVTKARLK